MRSTVKTALALMILFFLALPSFAGAGSVWEQPLKICWEYRSDQVSGIQGASDNVSIFLLPKTNAQLDALSANRGQLIWNLEFGGSMISSPGIVSGEVFFSAIVDDGTGGRILRHFRADLLTGISKTEGEVQLSPGSSAVAYGESSIVLDQGRTLTRFNSKGEIVWSRDLEQPDAKLIKIADKTVLITTPDGAAILFSAEDGSSLGRFITGSTVSGAFARDRGSFYLGTNDGRVLKFSQEGEDPDWNARTGGGISGLDVIEGDLLVYSNDNFVYRLSDYNGSRIWKRKLAGRIIGREILDNRTLAIVTYGSNDVVFLRSVDGRITNTISVTGARTFAGKPTLINGRLLVPADTGLFAVGPVSVCEENRDGQ